MIEDADVSMLYEALDDLTLLQKNIINQRFWDNKTILEIAESLNISWEDVDEIIDSTLLQMKKRLLNLGEQNKNKEEYNKGEKKYDGKKYTNKKYKRNYTKQHANQCAN